MNRTYKVHLMCENINTTQNNFLLHASMEIQASKIIIIIIIIINKNKHMLRCYQHNAGQIKYRQPLKMW
jgi:hypothetical protein